MQKIRQDLWIGSRIRQLRNESGLTQEQTVAQMQVMGCTLSRETYAKIESGISNIRVSELVALTRIFRVDFNALFQDVA